MDFSWLSDIFNGILQFIPRPLIIRATHGGIVWVFGSKVVELKPGWRWVWPLIMDWEIIPVARQTERIQDQALITKDSKQVVVRVIVIYSIRDLVQAIGQRNWDVGTTVNDIAAAAVIQVVTKWELNDLLTEITGTVEEQLTETCKRELNKFGVTVHKCCFIDFSTCRVYKIMGNSPVETEE